MRVLIIDDEDDVSRVALLSLVNVGHMEVQRAASAREGLEKARTFKPDAILLDVMMPDMDGRAALAALRNEVATEAIPVVFVTARAMRSEIDELMALGARGVLTKPFNALTLPDDLRRLLL
ncbi:MAG: response regulator [Thermoanaerobaculia bacterium]